MNTNKIIERPFIDELRFNLEKTSQFIQVILGPRQVGKSTGIDLFLEKYKKPFFLTSGDEFRGEALSWIKEQWQYALDQGESSLLIIDEIQKIPNWSQVIKGLWDKEIKKSKPLKLVLLGSSSLQLQKGLTESLTGRFQAIRVYHWSFHESLKLNKMTIAEYLKYGGYPGSYTLLKNEIKWNQYIQNSIIETVINKDILTQAQIKNPALFRQSFILLSGLPAQEVSYTKLLGQLQDKGNTDLIKSYIELFEGAFLFKAISKYHPQSLRLRSSSPKIIPLCPALIDRLFYRNKEDHGRIFESCVGARLCQLDIPLYYWRDGDYEVDYVIELKKYLIAIEVKSGKRKSSKSLSEFLKKYPKAKTIFIRPENFEKFDLDPIAYIEKHLN